MEEYFDKLVEVISTFDDFDDSVDVSLHDPRSNKKGALKFAFQGDELCILVKRPVHDSLIDPVKQIDFRFIFKEGPLEGLSFQLEPDSSLVICGGMFPVYEKCKDRWIFCLANLRFICTRRSPGNGLQLAIETYNGEVLTHIGYSGYGRPSRKLRTPEFDTVTNFLSPADIVRHFIDPSEQEGYAKNGVWYPKK